MKLPAAQYNDKISMYLEHPMHATYLSSQIQNELIDIIGTHILQNNLIVREI